MTLKRIFLTLALFFIPFFTYAQHPLYPTPLTVIPGITDEKTLSNISTQGLVGFLNGIITFTFTLAAIASVVMIVMVGFEYATTEKSGRMVSILKGKMTSIALGVALIASMFIIFDYINPQITENIDFLTEGYKNKLTPPSAAVNTNTPTQEFKQQINTNNLTKEFIASDKNSLKASQDYAASIENACKELSGKVTLNTETYSEYNSDGAEEMKDIHIVRCSIPKAIEVDVETAKKIAAMTVSFNKYATEENKKRANEFATLNKDECNINGGVITVTENIVNIYKNNYTVECKVTSKN